MQEAVQLDDSWRQRVKPGVVEKLEKCADDPDFTNAQTFRDQCFHIFTHYPEISNYQLGQFFARDKSSIKFQRKRFVTPPQTHGRPAILTENQASRVIQYIRERLADSRPPTCNDVLNFIFEELGISMIPDTFRHWINRKTEFCTASAPPMEEKRLGVTREQILSHFHALKRAVEGVPASLVLNLDESGFQRFADARNETVISEKGAPTPLHPVSRSEKRATFLATITASGNFLKPLMIVSRTTIEAELFCAGYDYEQVLFATSQEGYITKQLFRRYIEQVLVPYVRVTRENIGYHGRAVLIMDGCSCHIDAELDKIFDRHGVTVVFLPAHSSDQLQPLDVGIFGNQKANQSRIHVRDTMSQQTQQVIRALSAFQAVAHPYAVTSAFRKAGLSTFWRDGRVFVDVTIYSAKYVRGLNDQDKGEPTALDEGQKIRVDLRHLDWGPRQDRYLDDAGYRL